MRPEIPFDPTAELDFLRFQAEVGRLSTILPLISAFARHKQPGSTLPYIHPTLPEDKAAAAFINDLLRGDTGELLKKWFLPGAREEFIKGKPTGAFELSRWMIVRKSVLERPIPHGGFSGGSLDVKDEPYIRFKLEPNLEESATDDLGSSASRKGPA